MKVLSLTTVCLFTVNTYAQSTSQQPVAPVVVQPVANEVIAPAPVLQNQAVAPSVFYAPAAGEKTVSPQAIEVEVPVYQAFQPRAEVAKIFKEIKGSEFFFEVKPIRLKGTSMDFKSDLISVNNNRELEYEESSFKAKLMPLDFKFGFENSGWGSFAEVQIEDGSDSSEVVIFGKIGSSVRLGGGLSFYTSDEEAEVKSDSIVVAKGEADSTVISPYFYAAFQFVNDDLVIIEQSNKIGGSYAKYESGDLKIKGVSFDFTPALDIMFKINPKLQIGGGIEFAYSRFSGDITNANKTFGGVGNNFDFELNLFKTKFIF